MQDCKTCVLTAIHHTSTHCHTGKAPILAAARLEDVVFCEHSMDLTAPGLRHCVPSSQKQSRTMPNSSHLLKDQNRLASMGKKKVNWFKDRGEAPEVQRQRRTNRSTKQIKRPPLQTLSGCELVSTTTAVRPDWQSFLQASASVSLCQQEVVSRSSTTSETR